MAASLLNRFNVAIQRFEYAIAHAFGRGFPPADGLCLATLELSHCPGNSAVGQEVGREKPKFSLKDLVGDGFLWAVPKFRRTVEKKHKRKFGSPDGVLKIMLPKTNLQNCNVCGDDHEIGLLCPTCYKKVQEETKLMQEKIQEKLGLSPVENEVIVLYDGEKEEKPAEFWEGKRIVEMDKPRPSWFSKNLLQQTTQPLATTKDVKPSKLG